MLETLDSVFGLTAPQTAIWLDQAFYPGKPIYNTGQTVAINGALDAELFIAALRQLVQETDALRLALRPEGDAVRQAVRTDAELAIDREDFSVAPDPTAAAERWIEAAFWRPIGSGDFPLFHFALLRLGNARHLWLQQYHHLVVDATARRLVTARAAEIYAALQTGCVPPASAGAPFAEVYQAEETYRRSATYANDRRYWLDRFAILPEPLFADDVKLSERARSGRPARLATKIERGLFERLARLAQSQSSTAFKAVVALVHIAFSRFYGQRDIVFGVPLANRPTAKFRATVGLFAQVMPFRLDVPQTASLAEALALVDGALAQDVTHRRFPFFELGGALHLARQGRAGLFDVTINFLATDYGIDIAGAPVEVTNLSSGFFTRWAITIADLGAANGIDFIVDYDPGLVEAKAAAQLARSLRFLLEHGLDHLGIPVGEMPIMAPVDADAERRRIAAWNDTARAYPREACIHALFEAQAARTPDATALTFGDAALTYRALDARANQMAHYLRRLWVGPEVVVGIAVERSLEMVVGILGILKAGGAYVPLDPSYPLSRLEFMLRDTEAPVLLTQARLRHSLPAFQGRVISIDDEWPEIERESTDAPAVTANADNLAYVMYTSGSTGAPKGVCIEHHSVVRLVTNTNYVTLGPEETMLQLAPISFDAATFELWGSLLNGGRLVVFPPGLPSPAALAAAIREHVISTLWLTAALFHQMVDFDPGALSGVRQLLAGGEILSVAHVRRLLEALPAGHQLINGYGPTENTTFTCCHVMTRDSRIGRSVPIGRPIANTHVHILDERHRPVPLGVPGHLHIGGDGLARGYLNQPALTAEKFVTVGGQRLYRSGDNARYLVDGSIEFLGRSDDQVKLRGYRIELGEIEAVLSRHPSLRACIVLLRGTASTDKRLVAYVTGRDGAPAAADELRRFLRANLPGYMVPSDFVAMDAWPLTPSGKLDRHALPAPEERARPVSTDRRAPGSATEQVLAEIWAKHLGHQDFGVADDFFDAGGDSLAGVGVFMEIEARCGISLPLALLFEKPTIAALAAAIGAGTRRDSVSHLIAVQPNGGKPPIFALFGVGGSYLAYAAITKALGPDQPFYSLEMPGLEGDGTAFDRVEELAERFRDEMRDIRTAEPCVLIGACAGALVVFDLARYLAAEGRMVNLVVMLDPPPTGGSRPRRLSAHRLWRRLVLPRFLLGRIGLHLRTMLTLQGKGRREYLKQKLSVAREILRERDLFRASRQEISALRVLEATSAALTSFVPRPYGGRVALLLGDRYGPGAARDPVAEWRKLCTGSFETGRIPGKDTGAMLRQPNLGALVTRLKQLLAEAG